RDRVPDGQGNLFARQQHVDSPDRHLPRRAGQVRAGGGQGGPTSALPQSNVKYRSNPMANTVLPKPDPQALDSFLRAQGLALHAGDKPPATRKDWEERRARLRTAMFAAMGPFPEKPCALEPRVIGALKRQGYRIEKLIFQSRPDIWVTASAYIPQPAKGKLPPARGVPGAWRGS